VIFLGGGY